MTMEQQHAASLLAALQEPATVKEAEKEMRDCLKRNSKFVMAMYAQLKENPTPACRQMAATVLVGRVKRTKKIDLENFDLSADVTEFLLQQLFVESQHLVIQSLCMLISALCKKAWENWQPAVHRLLSSPEAKRQAVYLVKAILESDALRNVLQSSDRTLFFSVIVAGLKERPGTRECEIAMKASLPLLLEANSFEDAERVRALLPLVANVAHQSLSIPQAEATLEAAVDIFVESLRSEEILTHEQFPEVLRFVLTLITNSELSDTIRSSAVFFVLTVSEDYPPKLIMTYADDILSVLVPVILVEENGMDSGGQQAEAVSLGIQCLEVLDRMATRLASHKFFPKIVKAISPAMSQEGQIIARRGAVRILGAVAEGCCETMANSLADIATPVLLAVKSPNPLLRDSGAIALGQLADALQSEMVRMHSVVLQTLLEAIRRDDNSMATLAMLCHTLEIVCDPLGEPEFKSIIRDLIPTLLYILLNVRDNKVKEKSLGALASVACNAGDDLLSPFAADIERVLIEAVNAQEEEIIPLKSQAIFNTGHLFGSVSKNMAKRLQEGTLPAVLAVLNAPYETYKKFTLREACFAYLSHMVEAFRGEVDALVDSIMAPTLKTLESAEGITTLNTDIEEEEEEDTKMLVVPHYIGEAEAAIILLADMYKCISGEKLNSWLRRVLNVTKDCPAIKTLLHSRMEAAHVYENIMLNAHHALLPQWALRAGLDSVAPGDEKLQAELMSPEGLVLLTCKERRGWVPGIPAQCKMDPTVEALWVTEIWPELRSMIIDDPVKEVVREACDAFSTIVYVIGPHVLCAQNLNLAGELIEWASKVLAGDLKFGAADEDDEDWMSEETQLFQGVVEVVAAIACATGKQFQQSFDSVAKPLLRMAMGEVSQPYRCVGIGCLADMFQQIDFGDMSNVKMAMQLLEIALDGLRHPIEMLRQNCAYAVTSVCCLIGPHLSNVGSKILEALTCALSESEEAGPLRDNIVSALGALMRNVPVINLAAVIPQFLERLPLNDDFEESENIIKTLLWMKDEAAAIPVLEKLQMQWLTALAKEAVQADRSVSLKTRMMARNTLWDAFQKLGRDHEIVVAILQDSQVRRFLYK